MTIDALPRAYATVTGTDAIFITPDGRHEPLSASRDEDIRRMVVQRATDEARRAGAIEPLCLTLRDVGANPLGDFGRGHVVHGDQSSAKQTLMLRRNAHDP